MKRVSLLLTAIFMIVSIQSGMPQTKKDKKADEKARKGGGQGFGSVSWGSDIVKAKDSVLGKITYSDDKTLIVSKDGDVEYYYGFFYIDPAAGKGEDAKKAGSKDTDKGKKAEKKSPPPAPETQLFYVALIFPYVALEDVKKKMTEKYKEPTGENIKENQGALVWDSGQTLIVLWVDQYEKKPFCRKITYLSKEMSQKIKEYQQKAFSTKEREILNRIIP